MIAAVSELRRSGAALGINERHFRRLRDAYEVKGAEGLIDRRRERASGGERQRDRVAAGAPPLS
jgi:ABC-type thiamine transport system ATPase subunit